MIPEQVPSASPAYPTLPTRHCSPLSWGAVFAGAFAALALHVLFMLLGAGLGFAIYTPLTDANPVKDLTGGAMVVQGLSAVVSLWFGGWIAGRFTSRAGRRTGCLHGFMVWSLATVAAVLAVSIGSGWALGDLTKIVGGGLSMAGKPLAAAAGNATDLGKDSARKSANILNSFADEAVGDRPANSGQAGAVRTRRDVGMALERLFAPGQDSNLPANRAAAAKVLVDDAGMSQPDADKLVADWSTSYQNLKDQLTQAKNEADARARQVAEEGSRVLSILSLCSFLAFLIGAIAAASGGKHGALRADRYAAGTATDVEI
jgi:hypothetical protein